MLREVSSKGSGSRDIERKTPSKLTMVVQLQQINSYREALERDNHVRCIKVAKMASAQSYMDMV